MPSRRSRRRPLYMEFGQGFVRWFFRVALTLFYRIRVHHLRNYPAKDGFLLCSNHQSFLDPLVLGVVCPRPVNYLGRKTLFKFPPLAWFLRFNDTIPIDRDANSIGGMKETIRRLKRGESVVMFPEGTRSSDGELQPLQPGFLPLARRTKATLMPVGLDGAFQAYPRNRRFPVPGSIHAVMGKAITFADYVDLSDDEVVQLLSNRIAESFQEARQRWQREQGIVEPTELRPAELEII